MTDMFQDSPRAVASRKVMARAATSGRRWLSDERTSDLCVRCCQDYHLRRPYAAGPLPSALRAPGAECSSSRRHGNIALNSSIPWDIEIRGGISNIVANLRDLRLRSLDLGSVSQMVIMLPRPVGVAYIYVAGSASNVAIHRPPGIAVRVHIGNSASSIRFDEQRFDAMADSIHWQTTNYSDATDRYDISISGSVSEMSVNSW